MTSDTIMPRTILLALCAGGADALDEAEIAALDDAGWEWLGMRAGQYRMLPLLHSVLADRPDWPVPSKLRNACLEAHSFWVFRSLVMQQALIDISALLDRHGIAYSALKGASLSLEFYAEPALRPMRDLDIMVAADEAERAYALLIKAGFAKVPGYGDFGIEYKHHLPPIRNANAVEVELHHRLAPCEWSGSEPLSKRLLDNARIVDFQGHPIRMAHPTDTMLHLIVHAAFQHFFDNGPNLLSDWAALETSGMVDFEAARVFAVEHALLQSLEVVEALVREAQRTGQNTPPEVPAEMLDQVASLMTQAPEKHWQRHLLRKRRSLPQRVIEGAARALRPNAYDLSEIAQKDVSGLAALRYYPSWLVRKAQVHLSAEFEAGLDDEAADDAKLEAWIGRPKLTERDVKA